VLLPDTEAAGVGLTAERLRGAVAAEPFPVGGAAIELTISVGWADWRGEDPHEFVLRADRALYEAKTAGRNAVRPEPAASA
jgi:diguanylate cyclase (GGDEF)-like protein